MIYEITEKTIDPERRDEYVEVYRRAWAEAGFEGSRKGKIMRCIEDPARVIVLIEWDDLAAHRQHRQTPKQKRFIDTIHPYLKAPSINKHYEVDELTP